MDNTNVLSGNISVQAVEEQINSANSNVNFRKTTFDEKNYLNLKLNPGETSRTVRIRILPASESNPNFCVEVMTHSLKLSKKIAKSGFKAFPCLNDINIPQHNSNGCPLCKKAQEFFESSKKAKNEGNDVLAKTLYKQGCSYLKKKTYIVRVIERGKEDEGVKFWRFNANSKKEGYFDKIISLYKTRRDEYAAAGLDDNYNIFDLNNGRDLVLTLTKSVRSDGQEGVAINLTDASISSPLSKDLEQANAWIKDSKVWSDAYAIKNYEYLEIIADGKIPFKDKETGHYIGKTEEELQGNDDMTSIKEDTESILVDSSVVRQEQRNEGATPSSVQSLTDLVVDDDDELPF